MSEIEDHTVRLLQALREDVAKGFQLLKDEIADVRSEGIEFRQEMRVRFETVEHRFDILDKLLQGEGAMARYTVAGLEERMERLESFYSRFESSEQS